MIEKREYIMTTALTDFDSMFGIFILYFGEIKEQERINRRGKKLKHFYADAVMHVDSRYWRIFKDGKMLFGKYDYIDTDVWGKVFTLIREIIALKPMLIKIEMSVLGDCILYFTNGIHIEFFSMETDPSEVRIYHNDIRKSTIPNKNIVLYQQDIERL